MKNSGQTMQVKTCSLHGTFKTIKQTLFFPPFLSNDNKQSSGMWLYCWLCKAATKSFKMAEFRHSRLISSLYKQPFHLKSNLMNFNLRVQHCKSLCEVFRSKSLNCNPTFPKLSLVQTFCLATVVLPQFTECNATC